MTDDITPLQPRISAIVADEDRLNRNRKNALMTKQARRDVEKRSEAVNLLTLEKQKTHQVRTNADKERKFQEELKREGEELVNLSKEIRDDYIAEIRHREAAKEKLQAKVIALETKLRSIEGARP
ncbi:MAG: hypothetical protein G01um101425_391 [Candidatus Peregrinibacteria bacterium Gr01-1014_25]|nr:MAG: hypothetical protein G01um101425_391 [Candidatus Peregrinibacteria bacterium Gr01-1014_25]